MGSYALIKIAPMIWRYLMKVGIAAGIVTICSMQKTAIATMKIIIALRAMNANAAFPHRRRKSQPQKIWGHLGQHRCKKMNDYHELIGWLDENIKDLEEWIVLLGNATDALFYSGQSDALWDHNAMIEYMRECPPDEKEYFRCAVCFDEFHINDLEVFDCKRDQYICDGCAHDVDNDPMWNNETKRKPIREIECLKCGKVSCVCKW